MNSAPDKPTSPLPPVEAERDDKEEAFLQRWSRRKHEMRVQQTDAKQVATDRTEEKAIEPPKVPEKILTDADMPPLESLNEASDYSMFMSSGVSDALRSKALRKLFLSPDINQRFLLESEYYDCHGFTPLGNIVTHDMREEMAREAQKLKDAAMSALLDEKKTAAVSPSDEPPVSLADKADSQRSASLPSAAAQTEDKSPFVAPPPEARNT